jgi:hypothetical protein
VVAIRRYGWSSSSECALIGAPWLSQLHPFETIAILLAAGIPRDQRVLQLSRLTTKSRPELSATLHRVFQLPPAEVGLFLVMLQHDHLNSGGGDGAAGARVGCVPSAPQRTSTMVP